VKTAATLRVSFFCASHTSLHKALASVDGPGHYSFPLYGIHLYCITSGYAVAFFEHHLGTTNLDQNKKQGARLYDLALSECGGIREALFAS
jgi:hypothetical protein